VARARPAAAATEPAASVPRALRTASLQAPSSRSRTVSKVKVENVVYAPQKPVPRTTREVLESPWWKPRPVSRPRTNDPLTLTTNVPQGNTPSLRSLTKPSST
jgi:hypothetical protein